MSPRRRHAKPSGEHRRLTDEEIARLVGQGSVADDWSALRVCDGFDPARIRRCTFRGQVCIGSLQTGRTWRGLSLPPGLTDATLEDCSLGNDVVIHRAALVSGCEIADEALLLDVGVVTGRGEGTFGYGGRGADSDGDDDDRPWIEVANENGGRRILAGPGMLPAGAALWARARDRSKVLRRLVAWTDDACSSMGRRSRIGRGAAVVSCRTLRGVNLGAGSVVVGADRLENVSLESVPDEPVEIGEGVSLVDVVVQAGGKVLSGVKARRVVLGRCATLKLGARVCDSFVGDNSTIACCEVISSLVFPAHEQHHNNSFLIATTIGGQSNIAAGATIGSNHNSRAPDGEIVAGRGFWPGLCVSLKHNSRFASYVLLAKGDYPASLDVPLPFALVANDVARDRLVVMPAFWWLYNMYALARNSWKFRARDARAPGGQHVEFDALAPDTVREILRAMDLLAGWTARAHHGTPEPGEGGGQDDPQRWVRLGRELLSGGRKEVDSLQVLARGVEDSSRKVVVLKPGRAFAAYRQMLLLYAMDELAGYFREHRKATVASMARALGAADAADAWVNLGGQLVSKADEDALRDRIESGKIDSWSAFAEALDDLWQEYPRRRRQHALSVLRAVVALDHGDGARLTADRLAEYFREAVEIYDHVAEQVEASRRKDFDGSFRQMTFGSEAEMGAVLGSPDDDAFIASVAGQAGRFRGEVDKLLRRLK